MLNRSYFVFLIVLSLLLFSTKSKARTMVSSKYKIHSNFAKKPTQNSNTRMLDLLINLDDKDDDETTSKSKHKTSKAALAFKNKFNSSNQFNFLFGDPIFRISNSTGKFYPVNSLFSKTSISIAICCLKI